MIDKIKDIPRLPQVSMELIRHAFHEEPDIQKVSSIVERDPLLTVNLFKTVNSAAFGLKVEVKNMQQAISIIGLEALRSTVVALTLGDYFINNSLGNALNAKSFCNHSLATAVIMKRTAQLLNIQKADQLYLIGLLHDLGKMALDSMPGSEYGKVLQRVEAGKTFEEAEQEVLGWDNRQVWRSLAEAWDFPEEIITLFKGTVKGEVTYPTRKLMEDASNFADTLGYTFLGSVSPRSSDERDILFSFTEDVVMNIGKSVHQQIDAMAQVLDLPIPDNEQIKETLLRVSLQLSKTNAKYMKSQKELKLRVTVLEELAKVFTGIIKTPDNESFAYSVLEALMEGFKVDGAFLITATAHGDYYGYATRSNELGEPEVEQIRLSKDQITSSMQKSLETRSPIKVSHIEEEKVLIECLGHVSLVWIAPIFLKDKFCSILGLGIKNGQGLKFNSGVFGKVFKIVSEEVGLTIENARLYKRLRKEARYDTLTTLFNRRTIMSILTSEFARFKRKSIPLSVAVFDMDHFKTINDSFGHPTGDDFLMKSAQILKNGMRESDYIGRYGGDEFVAVFPDTPANYAYEVTERIRNQLLAFCTKFVDAEIGKHLSVSVGVAGADDSMSSSEELVKLADRALYQAKDTGRNCCVLIENTGASP